MIARTPTRHALIVFALALPLVAAGACRSRDQQREPLARYRNPDLPAVERAADLVRRMTVSEKIAQTMTAAPAIPRLGVPAYEWWSEALHGVARAGRATVFPQAIALAATFDEPLMRRVANVISDEARAKFNQAQARGQHGRYQGLTFFSPNVNIFRDPRWGRGHETFGEDPVLTTRMGVAFISGMQGDHPALWKTVATAKHFAVHSGPEADRHTFDARVSAHDLADTYLPQFEAIVRNARVASVMAAYNQVNGEACVASPTLLSGDAARPVGLPRLRGRRLRRHRRRLETSRAGVDARRGGGGRAARRHRPRLRANLPAPRRGARARPRSPRRSWTARSCGCSRRASGSGCSIRPSGCPGRGSGRS